MYHRRGIVMEINGKKGVILTPDGEFISKQFNGVLPQVGEEVTIRADQHYLAWGRWAVAALLMLIFITPAMAKMLFNSSDMPVTTAYVTVDINPSVELAVDQHDRVVGAKALNEDGKRVLHEVSIQGQLLKEAIITLVETAEKNGYLPDHSTGTVLVAVVNNGSSERQLKRLYGAGVAAQQVLENTVQIKTVHADREQRVEAGDLGLSTGKYAILLEALNEGLEINPDDLRGNTVARAIARAGGNLGDILDKAQAENDLQGKAQQLESKLGLIKKALKTIEPENTGKSSEAPGQKKKDDPEQEEGWEQQSAREASSVPQSVYGNTQDRNRGLGELIKSLFSKGTWMRNHDDGSSGKGKESDTGPSNKSSEKDKKDNRENRDKNYKKDVKDKDHDTGKSDLDGENSDTNKKQEN